jgi:hypothetical protein
LGDEDELGEKPQRKLCIEDKGAQKRRGRIWRSDLNWLRSSQNGVIELAYTAANHDEGTSNSGDLSRVQLAGNGKPTGKKPAQAATATIQTHPNSSYPTESPPQAKTTTTRRDGKSRLEDWAVAFAPCCTSKTTLSS